MDNRFRPVPAPRRSVAPPRKDLQPASLARLVAGDILATESHTMMYVGATPSGPHGMVHAYPGKNVCLEQMTAQNQQDWCHYDVFRADAPALAQLAARNAVSWSWPLGKAVPPDVKTTEYAPSRSLAEQDAVAAYKGQAGSVDDSKASGVQQQYRAWKNGAAPASPFEFDALYRAVKWACRQSSVFSENRGTTCCSFVIACYHAAAVWLLADQRSPGNAQAAVTQALGELKLQRGVKKSPEETQIFKRKEAVGGGYFADRSHRPFANRGQSGANANLPFADFAAAFLSELGRKPATLESVFTPALLMDARYIYSEVLFSKLQAGKDGRWAHMKIDLQA